MNKTTGIIVGLVVVVLIGLNLSQSNSKNKQTTTKDNTTIQTLKKENNQLKQTVNSLEKSLSEEKTSVSEEQETDTKKDEETNIIEQLIHAYYDKTKETNRAEQLQLVQKLTSDEVYNYLNNNKGETNFESDNLVSKVNNLSIFYNDTSEFIVRYELTFQDGVLDPTTFTLMSKGKLADNKITEFEVISNDKVNTK